MKILLFGKNGQVGWELQRALAPLGELVALGSDSMDYCGDLTNPEGIAETIQRIQPSVIVNAAAYTAVDQAEKEQQLAQQVNADILQTIAQEAKALDAWLIHYSTDYVFSGEGCVSWREDDVAEPVNTYGVTKRAGEIHITTHCPKHLIFRTSWVYGVRGNNFVKTILRLAKERTELQVVNDQIGAPTSAELIADCTAHAIRTVASLQPTKKRSLTGIYHLSASGETSWYDYAAYVLSEAQAHNRVFTPPKLKAIFTADYPTPAKRPLNSRLNTEKFTTTFGLILPSWKEGLSRMLTEIMEKRV